MKKVWLITFLLSLHAMYAQNLQTGDLFFVVSGKSPYSDAISQSTAFAEDSLAFDHVAMLWITADSVFNVIEAVPQNGVHITTLDSFLVSATHLKGRPGVVVKRLTGNFSPDDAVRNALRYLGQSYDWYFEPDNGCMYCSELIYESYLNNEGDHIFNTVPMNFKSSDGTIADFWIKLFEDAGKPVPQGERGTNPQDMSRDKQLIEVYRYF